MTAIKRHFLVGAFITPVQSVTIQMKATEQYFSCGAVYYAVQGGSDF